MTVVAVGVVAIPSSVFAAGFSEQLAESRKRRRMQRSVAATRIAKVLRGYLCRKKFKRMINELKDKDSQQSHNNQSYRERIKNEQPERHEWLDLLNNTHVRRVVANCGKCDMCRSRNGGICTAQDERFFLS